jgi:hypothetical protein
MSLRQPTFTTESHTGNPQAINLGYQPDARGYLLVTRPKTDSPWRDK